MGIEVRDEIPVREVEAGMKSPMIISILMLEELIAAVEFADGVGGDIGKLGNMTTTQRKVWEKYKAETVKFARNMLVAGGDVEEIERLIPPNSSRRSPSGVSVLFGDTHPVSVGIRLSVARF